jgi:hypothetical protein
MRARQDPHLGQARHAAADQARSAVYLFGAICPARGTGAALVMPTVSIEAMNPHLAEISQCVSLGAIAG